MKLPKLMGIVNVTPDSFSDGGNAYDARQALAQIRQLIADGADLIDIGAESTRPNAQAVSAEQEWQRLEPVLSHRNQFPADIPWSLDTRHAASAKKALTLGIDWINDVSAATNEALLQLVASSNANYALMHSLTVPANPSIILDNNNPVPELIHFAKEKTAMLETVGISRERIIFDPGIGFGKNAAQSLALLRDIATIKTQIGLPILIGHSRKSFLKGYCDGTAADRDPATLAVSLKLAEQGADYLRVHNMAAHRQAFAVWSDMHV